jgi:hypothetical protein
MPRTEREEKGQVCIALRETFRSPKPGNTYCTKRRDSSSSLIGGDDNKMARMIGRKKSWSLHGMGGSAGQGAGHPRYK